MRILLTTYPEKPIFQPMAPLAWALRAAGHEVRVASQPFFADTITQAGLTAVPVGRQTTDNWRRLTEAYPDRAASERVGLPEPYNAADPGQEAIGWTAMREGYRHVLEIWHKQNNVPLITDLVEYARFWQPDLVIWEATTYAGAIAAKACGAAHARMLWSCDIFGLTREKFLAQRPVGETCDPLGEWMAAYGRKYGYEFSEDMITGQFTLDHVPASLRTDAKLHYVSSQYVPYGGAAVVPKWLQEPPKRPRVALTLGTSTTEWFGDYTFSVQDALDALSDLDIEVVATIASSEQHKLERIPDNTRIVSYVPLDALAATCSVVINHAGPSTMLTTALHAVPQLTVPWEFDEPVLARLATEQGAALTIPGGRVTGSAIRDHVLQLLGEPVFATRAALLRDEMLALPAPSELTGELADLAAGYR
ncbi:activator-dependent family glycosyltransferase [Actinocrispum sp. NPDC049592]|uniref:activator-dependent family glycosyltransferase n=1 Tax=Actinocrispum sp. NPDC049592 TaxID=3154835 RepID=UPI0034244813